MTNRQRGKNEGRLKKGDKVKFFGCSKEQRQWGNNDDPEGKLIIGNEYIVEDIEVHTWHTKIMLQGVEGQFNSVCFKEV